MIISWNRILVDKLRVVQFFRRYFLHLWKQNNAHWRPPLVRALSQMNPVKELIACKNHFGCFRKI